jgi:hypothetical protein
MSHLWIVPSVLSIIYYVGIWECNVSLFVHLVWLLCANKLCGYNYAKIRPDESLLGFG